jgi:PAS domain S-box-containing protein
MPPLDNIASVFKVSDTPTLIINPDGPTFTIAHANDAYLEITGTRLPDIVGRALMEVFPEGDHDSSAKRKKTLRFALEQALICKKAHKERLSRYDIANPATGKLETRFWNSDTYPILDQENDVEYIVHMPTDVTEFVPDEHSSSLETEILSNKNFHHPLFNDYPDGVATIDLYGNFLSVNRVFCDITEATKDSLLQMSFIPLVAPDSFKSVFRFFQKAIRGEIQNFEARIVTAKGNYRTINITNLPIIDNKEVIGIYLIAKDITEMVHAKIQLDRNNQRISTILESITDGFIAFDQNWIITYFNREAEMILGVKREAVIGRSLWDVFPNAKNEKFYPEYYRALSDQVSVRFTEYVSAENIWLEVTAYPSGDGIAAYFKDVSEKVKSDLQLQEAIERYQALFDFSPLAKWVYDTESQKFLAANATAVREYGYSMQEFLSMNIKDIWLPADLPILEGVLETTVKAKQTSKFQGKLVKKSGEIIDAQIEGQPLASWGENARLIYALDITKRIEAERALKASEQRFKALVQEGSEFLAIVDPEGNYLYVSPTYRRLGMDPEDMLGMNIFDTLHEEDRERLRLLVPTLQPKTSVQIPPFRRLDANNEVHWLETVVTDLRDDPAVGGIVLNSKDVTKRIEAEKKIRESIDHYNNIIQTTSDAIYDWDLRSNELRWTKGFKEVFGHEQSGALLTESWFQLVHPEDRDRVVDAIADNLQNRAQRWKMEYRFRAADRNYRFVLDRGFFIYSETGEPERMIGALKDISERVNYLCSVDGSNRRLGEISWMQSHIVRAPLARIMGLSELLRYNEGEITQKELLGMLTDSANELDEIIRNILQQTKSI